MFKFILLSVLSFIFATVSFAAIGLRDDEGLTPLHRAAGAGNVTQVAELLKNGADLFALDSKMGVSVLHKGVYSGDATTVELLLKSGALINLQSPSNGDTPLHDAIYFRRGSDLSVIQTLLKYKPNLAIRNRAGLTPIESAEVLKSKDIIAVLEKYELSRQSSKSRQLMEAVRKNQAAEVSKLLKDDSKDVLLESDDQGFTPLLWAARQGYSNIVKILLDAGADPNQNDQWMGANSGHKAAFWGKTEVMKILVAHKLDVNARGGYNGYTPLHDAVSGNHYEVAKVLMQAGPDLTIRGHDGKSALDIAKANRNKQMVQLLTVGSSK